MLSVSTNIGSFYAKAAASSAAQGMDVAMERLATGKRINSAKDDAAGVAISSRLEANIRGLNQAVRNALDAQGLLDTAEGGLQEVEAILQRIRELAVQAANDTNSAADRANLDAEAQTLLAEIDRISTSTTWAGQKLLDGTFTNKRFQVGGGSAVDNRLHISLPSSDLSGLGLESNVTTLLEKSYETPVRQSTVEIAPEVSVFSKFISIANGKNALTWVVNSVSGSGYDIYYREFDEFGKPLEDSRIIHSSVSGVVDAISATALSDGTLAFAWADYAANNYNMMTMGVNGAVSLPANLNLTDGPSAGKDISELNILGLSGGNYLISFRDGPDDTLNPLGINYSNHANTGQFAQLYDNTGQQIKNTFGVNDHLPGHADGGRYMALKSGGFVSVWRSAHLPNDSLRTSVSARIFDSLGSPISGQFQVNDSIHEYQEGAQISVLKDGSFVVVWHDTATPSLDGSSRTIVAEHYEIDGTIRKNDFIANTTTENLQDTPRITPLEDGGYVISYTSVSFPNGVRDADRYAQRYDAQSERVGGEFLIKADNDPKEHIYQLGSIGFVSIHKASNGSLVLETFLTRAEALTIEKIDNLLNRVNSHRATLGALSNRLDHTVANNTNVLVNAQASLGRIMDADYALESTRLAKHQILQQASVAMLAQANASKQSILQLLEAR
jgi:flagellin